MTTNALVWITARDGSIHATRPPIFAAGQAMLCARSYDRRDLRLKAQPGLRDGQPAHACPACSAAAALSAPVVVRADPT